MIKVVLCDDHAVVRRGIRAHIFGVFSSIFKIFSVKDIKIKFHVV